MVVAMANLMVLMIILKIANALITRNKMDIKTLEKIIQDTVTQAHAMTEANKKWELDKMLKSLNIVWIDTMRLGSVYMFKNINNPLPISQVKLWTTVIWKAEVYVASLILAQDDTNPKF
jgi:hypothetical protein